MGLEYNIPEDWTESVLGDVMDIFSGKSRPKDNGIYPVYGGNGIHSYGDKYNQQNETLIIGRVGAYCGNVFKENNKFWLSDNALGVKSNEDSDLNYLYYKLKSMKLNNVSIGAAQPLLTQSLLKELEVIIPKKTSEQKAIAKVLTAFDDKIELLQAQNKTLENMAQTIFKEWFGKYQIGDELPEGWKFSPFYSIAKYINGAAFKSQDFSKEKIGLPIVKIAELKNGITDSTAFSKKVVDSKYQIDNGDILFSWSGSPETSIDIFLWTSGKALLNQHTFNVKVEEISERAWVYFLLKYNKALFIHLAKMKQTTGLGHVTISDLKDNLFLLPPKNVIKQFNKVFNGFLDKIEINQNQIQSLTKTRDTLLPKLMSGQVRVNNLKQTANA